MTLQIITNRQELIAWQSGLPAKQFSSLSGSEKPRIGFVPTMGALHDGHLTLIRKARIECQQVIVSIFVNPLQFGPTEDFGKYPRTFERDRELCEKEGVDAIFHPTVEVMYPGGQTGTTMVIPPEVLEKSLYGEYRPAFFSGVATVVTRLFNLIQPDVAYFGEKDFQQLVVIKKMVFDLQMPVKIVGVETVREKDGLAYSSRNVFLSEQQRGESPLLYKTLNSIAQHCKAGAPLPQLLADGIRTISALENVDLKYLVACDIATLEQLSVYRSPMVLLVAAKFKEIWLIDTLVVTD